MTNEKKKAGSINSKTYKKTWGDKKKKRDERKRPLFHVQKSLADAENLWARLDRETC